MLTTSISPTLGVLWRNPSWYVRFTHQNDTLLLFWHWSTLKIFCFHVLTLHSLLICNSKTKFWQFQKSVQCLTNKTPKNFYFSYAFCLILCEFYCFYVDAFLASITATVLTRRRSLLTPTSVLHHSWQFISVQDSWCSCLHCIPGSYVPPISAHVPLFFFARTLQDTNNILVHLFLCTAPVIRHSERIIC